MARTTFQASSPEEFHQKISEAALAHPQGAAVHIYSPEEYSGMKTFLTPDKSAGYALSGRDVVSVFKHPNSPHQGIGTRAMQHAINQGGETSDAFDTVLPHLYARAGMRVVARVPFNDKYAPKKGEGAAKDWKTEDFKPHNEGRPDVVFMVNDPETVNKPYRGRSQGRRVPDYDSGVDAQQKALEAIKRRNAAFGEGSQSGR